MRRIETPQGPFPGTGREEEKHRRQGRKLIAYKALAIIVILAATTFGLMTDGLYDGVSSLWLPVAAVVLALLAVAALARGFFDSVSGEGWVLISLLSALVLVKGLSMVWTVSETETIKETLRASMYLAAFAIALAADVAVPRVGWTIVATIAVVLAAFWETPYGWMLLLLLVAAALGASAFARSTVPEGERVTSLVDGLGLPVAAVAGYGLLQKVYPQDYPITSLDGYRVDSTLGYPNTTAVILGMGAVLTLSRMTALRNPLVRGLCAVLLLGCLVTIYLTLSRGGIWSLGIGLGVLFVLGTSRLQMLANLLTVGAPAAWLWWRMRDLGTLLVPNAPVQEKVADGLALRDDLLLAAFVAFVLQAGYAYLASRYELTSLAQRYLGLAVAAVAAVGALVFATLVVVGYGGVGRAVREVFSNPDQEGNAAQRLLSLGVGFRVDYWRVAWEAWLANPLTGTGAGTFQYTWLLGREDVQGVKQVHNLYLEQGTETGLFAFLALAGFIAFLLAVTVRSAWRLQEGEGRLLLAGLIGAVVIYLASSAVEWHWYLPAATLLFFVLAAVTVRLARPGEVRKGGPADGTNRGAG